MNKFKVLFICLMLFGLSSSYAEEWVFYTYGQSIGLKKGNAKRFYNAQSLKQIDDRVYEVRHKKNLADDDSGYTIAQYWINCNQKKMAIGESITYIAGRELQRLDLSSYGWFVPRPTDPETKLMDIICK